MCGICGVVNPDGYSVDETELISARDELVHRGPDSAGVIVDGNVGLGHRRLSIIDVSGGQQPLSNDDKSLWITFNGEIYNYVDLKRDLTGRGHRFNTKSDTETIVRLYEEVGPDCVDKLNGMFAFAIWDRRKRRLFAARDRLGEKPFYYYENDGYFAFASEIKALLKFNKVPRSLNTKGIHEYLAFKYLAGENTLFRGIKVLQPGHCLIYQGGRLTIRKYWDIGQRESRQHETPTIGNVIERLDQLLVRSVEERLMSEVPLGTYNSGGLDSSLVTAITSSKINRPVHTFSIGFEEPEYDESRYAEMVAQACKTNHHALRITGNMFADDLPTAIWLNDEPLNHANSVPLYLLSKHAKKYVTVVLTGEGADELLGGYPRYFILKYLQLYWKLPTSARSLIRTLICRYSDRRLRKICEVLSVSRNDAIIYNSTYMKPVTLHRVLEPSLRTDQYVERLSLLDSAPSNDDLERMFYFEMKSYLVSILNRADKMSMGASVEGRVPFLDHLFVEFCFQLPIHYRLYGIRTKYVLKRYAVRYLPASIVNRKKSGFGIPLASWLRDPMALGRYLEILKDPAFMSLGLFNVREVHAIIAEHQKGAADHSEILWELINFELWRRMYHV